LIVGLLRPQIQDKIFEGLFGGGPGDKATRTGTNIIFITAIMSQTSGAATLLARQFKQMQSAKDLPGISVGLLNNNVFEWEVMLMISDDCKYYGGNLISFSTHHVSVLTSTQEVIFVATSPSHKPTLSSHQN
jgi:hypothetical protein